MSAGIVSVTSMSRSVAFMRRPPSSARSRTFDRMGMVLRSSTTRCTCPSDFSNAALSTVTLMAGPVMVGAVRSGAPVRCCWSGAHPEKRDAAPDEAGAADWRRTPRNARPGRAPRHNIVARGPPGRAPGLFLQHALEQLDLVAQRVVLAQSLLDLAHRVQHGGVVAPAEAAADLRQGPQGEHLRQVHGDLARAHHRGGAALRQDVGAGHVVPGGAELLDVPDLYAPRLPGWHEGAGPGL